MDAAPAGTCRRHRLPKRALLRKTAEYAVVYRQGKRVRGAHFTIIFAANGRGYCRLGVSVHGVKKAVRRNRIKRIIREYFRLERDALQRALTGNDTSAGLDIVFAVRREFAALSLAEFRGAVEQALAKRRGRRGGQAAR